MSIVCVSVYYMLTHYSCDGQSNIRLFWTGLLYVRYLFSCVATHRRSTTRIALSYELLRGEATIDLHY